VQQSFAGWDTILGPEMAARRVRLWAFPLPNGRRFGEGAKLAAGQGKEMPKAGARFISVNDTATRRQPGAIGKENSFSLGFFKKLSPRECTASALATRTGVWFPRGKGKGGKVYKVQTQGNGPTSST